MEDPVLTGVASEGGYAKIILRSLPAEMASMTRVLDHLSEVGVSVDLLSQMDTGAGTRDIQLTLREDELEEGRRVCDAVVTELGGSGVDVDREMARITLVGSGMHKRPGVYARAFRALNADGVAVHAVSASSVSIILMVDAGLEERALRVIHDTFELGEEAG